MMYQPSDPVDFLVIGAGAAGGVMAKELSSAGFRVVVLEQGPWLKAADFRHDEVERRFPERPHQQPAPAAEYLSCHCRTNEAKIRPAVEYGRMVGGGSVHFTGNYWRFHPDDFRERSVFGAVAGRGSARLAHLLRRIGAVLHTRRNRNSASPAWADRIPSTDRVPNHIRFRPCR